MAEDSQSEDVNNNDSVIEQLKNDLDSAMNNWKRTAADFENYKRQKEKESRELIEFAREVTVAKLLPTLDTLAQALKHIPQLNQPISKSANQQDSGSADGQASRLADEQFVKQYQNWQVGISGILMQLDKVLEEFGVKKIEAVGKKFDPHLHEAVKEVESESPDGMIVDELQSGFELNGKVIRASQVVVSKKK